MWWLLAPSRRATLRVRPAFIAKAVKNSRTSSVSKLPIFGLGNSTFQTRNGRPERSSAARTSASSIGSRQAP